jgi:hypothetical protein
LVEPTSEGANLDLTPYRQAPDHVDSDYASVLVAAKRARQINPHYNLGEGTSTVAADSIPGRRTI